MASQLGHHRLLKPELLLLLRAPHLFPPYLQDVELCYLCLYTATEQADLNLPLRNNMDVLLESSHLSIKRHFKLKQM